MKPEQTKVEMPTKESTKTLIHDSKHFPFQVIEITTINNETEEEVTQFKIGVGGAIMSEKVFKTLENAEKYIGGRPWELITNIICFTIQNAIQYEKSQSNS